MMAVSTSSSLPAYLEFLHVLFSHPRKTINPGALLCPVLLWVLFGNKEETDV